MTPLPTWINTVLSAFTPLFSNRVWQHTQILIIGAILAPGKRTITSVLRIMGLSFETHFQNYHRVLNRAVWSNLKASRILLGLLISAFVPTGPLILGLDDTIERRKGAKIAAKGIYRDPVRSSQSHFVKTSGLRFLLVRQHLTGYSRWLCLMLLVPIPFASRVWALPFMTVLAASERYNTEQGKPHRKLTDWARVMLRTVQRWFPARQLVVVADSAYAVIDWLAGLQKLSVPITVITRLRLDAALYAPMKERKAGQKGRPGVKGMRLPTLAAELENPETVWTRIRVLNWYGQGDRTVEISSQTAVWYHKGIQPVNIRWVLIRDPDGKFKSQALLCTDLTLEPTLILEWFVLRWCVEVTFEESRAHLGVESQRQWSGLAIARTTPVLFGLFSLVVLLGQHRWEQVGFSVRQAAWYEKGLPTFSDALAEVRRELWVGSSFVTCSGGQDVLKVPRVWVERLTDALCYAA
jgi:hypothetical protein